MIHTEIFEAPAWNRSEILRYARMRDAENTYNTLIDECVALSEPLLHYRVCYAVLDVICDKTGLTLGNIRTESTVLHKVLRTGEKAVLFAATIGAPFDRLIQRYSLLSPAKAVVLQAIGAERVESLCDAFCDKMNTELSAAGKRLTPRVSPGYGDIPLSMQRDIFALLDCPRKIGLTLDESLLMSPSKSVTAIAGITEDSIRTNTGRCGSCDKHDCIYRTEDKL